MWGFPVDNAVFPINMENVRILKDIKPVTAERRGNYLISEPNYATKLFTEKPISNRNEKNLNINESVCLFRVINIWSK